jgi:tetratricopeptide (TPR) repeat protein
MNTIRSLVLSAVAAAMFALPIAVQAADDLGLQAIQNRDWVAAEQQLLAGLQKAPEDGFRKLNLAWVYGQTGRKAEAAALYEEILRRDQDRVATLSARDGKSMTLLARRGLALLNRK